MLCGKLEKTQARFGRTQQQFTLVTVHGVPFVDGDHDGAPRFQNVARNMCVLVGNALGGVEQ